MLQFGVSVFLEGTQDHFFKIDVVGAGAVERGRQPPFTVCHAAIHAVVAVTQDGGVPYVLKNGGLQFVPAMDHGFLQEKTPLFHITEAL